MRILDTGLWSISFQEKLKFKWHLMTYLICLNFPTLLSLLKGRFLTSRKIMNSKASVRFDITTGPTSTMMELHTLKTFMINCKKHKRKFVLQDGVLLLISFLSVPVKETIFKTHPQDSTELLIELPKEESKSSSLFSKSQVFSLTMIHSTFGACLKT